MCRDGHRISATRQVAPSRELASVGAASSPATVDVDELLLQQSLPPADTGLGEGVQVTRLEVPKGLRVDNAEDSIGGRHPHLVPLWSSANPVSIFEVRIGKDNAPKWEWICPECSTPSHQTARNVVREWNRGEKDRGSGRLNCRSCLSRNAGIRSKLAGLRRGAVATDSVMLTLWHEENDVPAEEVSLKNSKLYPLWRCPSDIHPAYRKRVDHMYAALSEGKSGCPNCVHNGFDKSKDGFMYVLSNPDTGMLKVGITNDLDRRLAEHARNGFSHVLDRSDISMPGEEAYRREQRILKYLRRNGITMGNQIQDAEEHDGYSETWASGQLFATSLVTLMRLTREDETARGIVLDED